MGCQWPHSDWAQRTDDNHAPRPGGNPTVLALYKLAARTVYGTAEINSCGEHDKMGFIGCLSIWGFDDMHAVTLRNCAGGWYAMTRRSLTESAARKALRMPKAIVQSATRESEIVPRCRATSIALDKAKKVLALRVDPESPKASCYVRNAVDGSMRDIPAGLNPSRAPAAGSRRMIRTT